MDKIIPAHPASFETDYNQILDQVRYSRQIEAIDRFLEDKIRGTYIVVDPIYGKCQFKREIWSSKVSQ